MVDPVRLELTIIRKSGGSISGPDYKSGALTDYATGLCTKASEALVI